MSEEIEDPADVPVAHVNAILRLAQHPSAPLVAAVLLVPLSSYLMTEYVNPAIQNGIDDHKEDSDAHSAQFEEISEIKERMEALEAEVAKGSVEMVSVLTDVKGALIALERKE